MREKPSLIRAKAYCCYDIDTKRTMRIGGIDEKYVIKTKKGERISPDYTVEWKTVKNPNYEPKSLGPKWCRKYNKKFKPQALCIGYGQEGRCPFLLVADKVKPT